MHSPFTCPLDAVHRHLASLSDMCFLRRSLNSVATCAWESASLVVTPLFRCSLIYRSKFEWFMKGDATRIVLKCDPASNSISFLDDLELEPVWDCCWHDNKRHKTCLNLSQSSFAICFQSKEVRNARVYPLNICGRMLPFSFQSFSETIPMQSTVDVISRM